VEVSLTFAITYFFYSTLQWVANVQN